MGGVPYELFTEPKRNLMPNQAMDATEMAIATEFVDELVKFGVLQSVPPEFLRANAPLFCVRKMGQWRPIANMKKGGQNAHIGKDPVYLP